MRKDHRPYFVKKAYLKFQNFYANHFLGPHFECFGKGHSFQNPWHVKVFGSPIELGDYASVVAASDNKIRLSVWSDKDYQGSIKIGQYCLLCPGVRISSASGVSIGDNCMIANGVYITDSDWHGIYNRTSFGKSAPITIEKNVWIGDSSIICKGVTIGENSIIGAGTVVTRFIAPNSVAVGNPAKIIRQLDEPFEMKTRAEWFSDPKRLFDEMDKFDRDILRHNTVIHWLRYLFFPARRD